VCVGAGLAKSDCVVGRLVCVPVGAWVQVPRGPRAQAEAEVLVQASSQLSEVAVLRQTHHIQDETDVDGVEATIGTGFLDPARDRSHREQHVVHGGPMALAARIAFELSNAVVDGVVFHEFGLADLMFSAKRSLDLDRFTSDVVGLLLDLDLLHLGK
jgi:hypothetical protein